eukprot:gene1309-1896_t
MKDQGSPPGAKPPGAKRVTLVEPPTKPTGAGNAGAHRMPQANLTSDQSSSDGNVSAIKNARSQRIGEKEMLRRKVEQAEARSRRLEAENEHLKSLRKLQDEETQRAERKNFRFAAILKSFQEHFPDVEETVWNIFRDDMEAKDWEMLPMFHESALWRQNVQVEQEERNRRLSEWALRTYRNRFIHVAWRGWTTFLQDCHDTRLFERMKESFNFWLSLKRLGDRNREAKRIVSRLKMRNAYRQWNILRQRRLVIQEWHVETVEVYQWRMANVKAMLMLKLGNCFDAWYCALEGLKHARINLERVQHRLRIRKLTSFFVAWANYIDEAMEEREAEEERAREREERAREREERARERAREMESAAAEARSETSDEEEANNNQDAAEGRLSWMDVGDEELLEAANAKAGEPQTRPRTTSSIAERWRKKVESMKNGEVDDALNERLDMIRQLKQELSIDSLESDNVEESDAVGELPAPDSQAEQNTANDDSSPARPPFYGNAQTQIAYRRKIRRALHFWRHKHLLVSFHAWKNGDNPGKKEVSNVIGRRNVLWMKKYRLRQLLRLWILWNERMVRNKRIVMRVMRMRDGNAMRMVRNKRIVMRVMRMRDGNAMIKAILDRMQNVRLHQLMDQWWEYHQNESEKTEIVKRFRRHEARMIRKAVAKKWQVWAKNEMQCRLRVERTVRRLWGDVLRFQFGFWFQVAMHKKTYEFKVKTALLRLYSHRQNITFRHWLNRAKRNSRNATKTMHVGLLNRIADTELWFAEQLSKAMSLIVRAKKDAELERVTGFPVERSLLFTIKYSEVEMNCCTSAAYPGDGVAVEITRAEIKKMRDMLLSGEMAQLQSHEARSTLGRTVDMVCSELNELQSQASGTKVKQLKFETRLRKQASEDKMLMERKMQQVMAGLQNGTIEAVIAALNHAPDKGSHSSQQTPQLIGMDDVKEKEQKPRKVKPTVFQLMLPENEDGPLEGWPGGENSPGSPQLVMVPTSPTRPQQKRFSPPMRALAHETRSSGPNAAQQQGGRSAPSMELPEVKKIVIAKEIPSSSSLRPGGQRNWVQVAANGGVPTALAVACGVLSGVQEPLITAAAHPMVPMLMCGFMGYYACCCGDTWASE